MVPSSYRVTREELYLAVWLYNVHCSSRLRGHTTAQGTHELNESVMIFRRAEMSGQDIPSMSQAIDWYNCTDLA